MMLLSSCSDRQSEQPCGIGAEAGRPVENSKPSEVVGEVFRGNTLEADHPCAQARTKGIDVLHMPSALYAHARRQIDRMMLDFEVSRGCCEGGAPIGTQHRVGRQDWPQNPADLLSAHRFEHEIGGATHAVARNEYGNLFKRQSALGGLATALARCTADSPTLALTGAKEIRFVRLSDADQRLGLHGLGQRQETMAPAKSRTLGYMEPLTDLTQAQPVSQGFSLPQPLIAQMQMRQGRSGQRIEGAIAVATPEPQQLMA